MGGTLTATSLGQMCDKGVTERKEEFVREKAETVLKSTDCRM